MEPSGTQAASEALSNKRPWSVTLLASGVLIITVINLIRLVLSIRYWGFLSSRLGISPLYLALTGLIWTIAGSLLIFGLWRAKNWAPKLMQAVGLTYALYYWLDLIFVKDHLASGESGAISALLPVNWQFSAGLTVVCLAYMVWTLGRSKVKAYFGLVESVTDQNQASNDDLG
ncbi:MAG: hypothetical protein WAM09_13205 [Anaerolineales bacterium]